MTVYILYNRYQSVDGDRQQYLDFCSFEAPDNEPIVHAVRAKVKELIRNDKSMILLCAVVKVVGTDSYVTK
jgi:hypothetical protein